MINKADLVILSSPVLEDSIKALKSNIPVMVARSFHSELQKLEPTFRFGS